MLLTQDTTGRASIRELAQYRGVHRMEQTDRIEIRLLGRLHVRRSDSSVVDPGEWRTGKTIDLLRLLALSADSPVRIGSLLDKLWPDVDEARARASLRTAASQIRRTLRSDCIERRLGGLVLTNAWVDVTAFRSLATEAKACMRSRQFARVVVLAREAEALYLKDFEAHDDGSAWASEVRESLTTLRRTLLADAAESAVELHLMRDGIDLASRAISADPCSERPHRSLIQAYAGLGETEQALRAFDHCRTMLADELGADPSPQTRAAHMQVLAGHIDVADTPRFVGRERDVARLASVLDAASYVGGFEVVCVTGPAGSGRDALIEASAVRIGANLVHAVPESGFGLPSGNDLRNLTGVGEKTVVVLPAMDDITPQVASELVTTLTGLDGAVSLVVAVPASPRVTAVLGNAFEEISSDVRSVVVGTLSDQDITALAAALLSGPITRSITEGLKEESGALAGRAVATLRRWSSSGRVVSTAHGLELVPVGVDTDTDLEIGGLVRQVLEQLSTREMDIAHLVALINAPVMPSMLLPLLGTVEVDADDVSAVLDHLVDMGALRFGERGYEFRHPVMRDATDSWLRPTVRRRLHRRIAQSTLVSEDARATHWIKAGEPHRACESAIKAAQLAHGRGDRSNSEAQLARVPSMAEGLASSPAEHAGVLEALGDAAENLELFRHAHDAYAAALDAARSGDLPSVLRLTERVDHCAARESGSAKGHGHLVGFPEVLQILAEDGWGAALEKRVAELRATLGSQPGTVLEVRLSLSEPSKGATVTIPSQRAARAKRSNGEPNAEVA